MFFFNLLHSLRALFQSLDLGVLARRFYFCRGCVCVCVCVVVPAESSCLLWRLQPICLPLPLTRSHRLPWRPSTFANSECLWMENGSACESWMTSHLRLTQSLPMKVWSDPVHSISPAPSLLQQAGRARDRQEETLLLTVNDLLYFTGNKYFPCPLKYPCKRCWCLLRVLCL